MTVFKGVNVYQMISIAGIVAVLVILSIILTNNRDQKFAEEKTIYEGVVIDDTQSSAVLGDVDSVLSDEFVGSVPSTGVVSSDTYVDVENGFELSVGESFSQESGAVARLPFYWQERYEGSQFNDGVEMFVVDNDYQTFVSAITYGLGETFITSNEVVVTPRTTGYGNSFVHQAYVDLQDGKTLLLELRTNTENYPQQLKTYVETMETV